MGITRRYKHPGAYETFKIPCSNERVRETLTEFWHSRAYESAVTTAKRMYMPIDATDFISAKSVIL